jgi:hypothetical protein
MPGECLKRSQVDSRTAAERQVRMPEGMEVSEFRPVRAVHDVGDAGGV